MKRVVFFVGLLFSLLPSLAAENVLQTIEIEPVKDTYNIVLVSDRAVDVKKTVIESNKINIDLKDIRASKTLNTVYNNVSNVDTVMVEPHGNGVRIFFQADNAELSTISFDSLAPAVAPAPITKQSKNLKLNNPIESYAPIYKEDFEQTKTSNLFNKLKSSSAVSEIKDSIAEEGSDVPFNKIFSYGLVGLLFVAAARLFKRKEPDLKIGLAQQFKDQTLGQPIAQTHQSAYSKPFTTVNYGINAYKNESRNPYETAPMTFHNPRLSEYSAARPVAATAPMQQTSVQTMTAVKEQQKKMTTPVNTAPVNQSNPNIDNLKFLESMTAIYEKSGRHDLARGLKESLSKNNLK